MKKGAMAFVGMLLASQNGLAQSENAAPSGGRVGVGFGGATAVGEGSGNVGFGIGVRGWGGYEIVRGSVGFMPRLAVGYTKFLEKDVEFMGSTGSYSASILNVLPGVRLAQTRRKSRMYAHAAFGFSHLSASAKLGGISAKITDDKPTLAVGTGLDINLSRAFALGGFLDFVISNLPDYEGKFLAFGVAATISF